jgi:hypothetical protein
VGPAPADLRRQLDLWESIARRFGWQQPLLTDLDGSPLAFVTAHRPKNEADSWAWLVGVVEQVHRQNPSLYAAASGVGTTLASLPRSRSEAEEVSLLMDKRALHGPSCRLEDAWATVTLARASAGIRVESGLLGGPCRRSWPTTPTMGQNIPRRWRRTWTTSVSPNALPWPCTSTPTPCATGCTGWPT